MAGCTLSKRDETDVIKDNCVWKKLIRNLWTVSETFGFGSEYQTKNTVSTELCQLKVP